jgi:hypothetical protein
VTRLSVRFHLLDLFASDLPGALNDPGHRAIESVRFGDNFDEHAVLEIEALFALVGLTAGHGVQLTARVSRLRGLVNYSVCGQRWRYPYSR